MVFRFPLRRPHSWARRSLFWEENWKVPADDWTHHMQLRIAGVCSISKRNWNSRSFLFPSEKKVDGNKKCWNNHSHFLLLYRGQKEKQPPALNLVFFCTWKWDKGEWVLFLPVTFVRWGWWGILVFLVLGAAWLGVRVYVCWSLIGISNVILRRKTCLKS